MIMFIIIIIISLMWLLSLLLLLLLSHYYTAMKEAQVWQGGSGEMKKITPTTWCLRNNIYTSTYIHIYTERRKRIDVCVYIYIYTYIFYKFFTKAFRVAIAPKRV